MEKEQFDVYCVNTGKTIRVNGGESLLEIYKLANPRLAHRPICAYVNNKTEELKYRVFGPKDIEFLDISHPAGMRTYVRSLSSVMYKAINDIIPRTRLRIEHRIAENHTRVIYSIPYSRRSRRLVLQLADSVDRIFTGIRFGQI